jgi:hypothetical protein
MHGRLKHNRLLSNILAKVLVRCNGFKIKLHIPEFIGPHTHMKEVIGRLVRWCTQTNHPLILIPLRSVSTHHYLRLRQTPLPSPTADATCQRFAARRRTSCLSRHAWPHPGLPHSCVTPPPTNVPTVSRATPLAPLSAPFARDPSISRCQHRRLLYSPGMLHRPQRLHPLQHSTGYHECTLEAPSGKRKPGRKRDPSDHHRCHRQESATNPEISSCVASKKKNKLLNVNVA